MSAVMQGAIAVAVSALVGVSGTVYAAGILRRRDETAAGIRTLAAMSWRDFIQLVLAAMARRGLVRDDGHASGSGGGKGDYTLVRGSERWTLWCKHGSAFVIGKLMVGELANEMRLAGTDGGLLVTQGRIVQDARDAAAPHGIELLDGPALWPEIRALLPPAQSASIRTAAARRARGRVAAVWMLALLAGAGAHGLAHQWLPVSPPPGPAATASIATGAAPPTPEAPAVPEPVPASSPASPPAAAPRQPASPPDGAGPSAALSPDEQRTAAARAVADLPMVERARWTSASTLQVDLATGDDAFDRICPLVERHPDIATSRIQLNLPAGSDVPVRFRQCRTF